MEKIARRIFQPNQLTNTLLEEACSSGEINISDFLNLLIEEHFTPQTPFLRQEIDLIFERIIRKEVIRKEELKYILARCMYRLKDYPIADVSVLEDIFFFLKQSNYGTKNYEYVQKVDDHQNFILHRLNRVLKTLDPDFTLGTREFDNCIYFTFRNWKSLCQYSEIYEALYTIVDLTDFFKPITAWDLIQLINKLDQTILSSNVEPIRDRYPTDISIEDEYFATRYELFTYQADNGYFALTDKPFDEASADIKEYFSKIQLLRTPDIITEDDLSVIKELERTGYQLFRRLSHSKRR